VSSWSDRGLVRPAWAQPGRSATVSPNEGVPRSTKSLGAGGLASNHYLKAIGNIEELVCDK